METLVLKAKTRQEVADEFGISEKTLHRRLEKAKIDLPPGVIFPKHLNVIYKKFGVPKSPKKS